MDLLTKQLKTYNNIGAVLVLISGYLVRKHAETVLRETQTINARVVSTPSFVAVRMAA